jgi:hypothetical protein
MCKVFTALALVFTLAALLGGCGKCDPWWGEKPGACHSATPTR